MLETAEEPAEEPDCPRAEEWKFLGNRSRRPPRLVPPAKRSRLMLHKYLRSRFAPGAPRRKHQRERGYASQAEPRVWQQRLLLTHHHPWGPTGDLSTDRRCLSIPEARDERERASQQADPGIQDSRFAVARSSENSLRQAVRLRLPQAVHTEPAPGTASDRNWALGSTIWAEESTPLPAGAWGRHCPARAPARDRR